MKRKLKKEKELKIEKLPKLDVFFKKPVETEIQSIESKTQECLSTSSISRPSTSNQTGESNSANRGFRLEDEGFTQNMSTVSVNINNNIIFTDLGNFLDKELNDELRKLIISSQPSRPGRPFPRDPKQEGRKFSDAYYNIQTKYGIVPRLWLCYSKILDSAYCEPCWLFSSKKNQWYTGVREWKNLSLKIQQHGVTNYHIQARKIYDLWKKNQTIDAETEKLIRYETSFWKQVLDRLFNIILILSRGSLALRGHREDISEIDEYHGHFLEQVKLLAKYVNIMKQVVEMLKGLIYHINYFLFFNSNKQKLILGSTRVRRSKMN